MKLQIIFFSVLLTTILIFPAMAEFSDDFNGELNPLWEVRGGKWEIKDGVYHGSSFGTIPAFAILPL